MIKTAAKIQFHCDLLSKIAKKYQNLPLRQTRENIFSLRQTNFPKINSRQVTAIRFHRVSKNQRPNVGLKKLFTSKFWHFIWYQGKQLIFIIIFLKERWQNLPKFDVLKYFQISALIKTWTSLNSRSFMQFASGAQLSFVKKWAALGSAAHWRSFSYTLISGVHFHSNYPDI